MRRSFDDTSDTEKRRPKPPEWNRGVRCSDTKSRVRDEDKEEEGKVYFTGLQLGGAHLEGHCATMQLFYGILDCSHHITNNYKV